MDRSYIAGCCVIIAAAGLGYWVFADKFSDRPPPQTWTPALESSEAANDRAIYYTTRTSPELIDLGRVFDPTGEELDLHNLLHGKPVAELIPLPREAEPELAPVPREQEREMLHAPRLVEGNRSDSSEDAQSPTAAFSVLHGPVAWIVAALVTEWLSGSLPLKGSDLPFADPQP
jgi:hypothetical protein